MTTPTVEVAAGVTQAAAFLAGDDSSLPRGERALAEWARRMVREPNATTESYVGELREAGFDERQIFALTVFVALRVAFSTVNGLPAASLDTWTRLGSVFLVDATAGLALGLLASALLSTAAQATLALPMLCFQQVLFSGAMVPVATMTGGGKAISSAMSNRWAFEAVARLLGLEASDARLAAWSGAITGGVGVRAVVLTAMTASSMLATVAVLSRQRAASG